MATLREEIITTIDGFVSRSGIPETTLSKEATGSTAAIGRFKRGERDLMVGTVEKILTYIRAWRPGKKRAS